MNNGLNGISDIASSEGNLIHFDIICRILEKDHSLRKKKIFELYAKELDTSSYNSFERKISIMQKLNMLQIVDNKCILDSSGKVVNKLISKNSLLDNSSKSFYFIILFKSIARNQLATLVKTINLQQGLQKKDILIKYFSTPIAQQLWDTASNNMQSLKDTGVIPSMINNKFTCMTKWLDTIDMIYQNRGKFYTNLSQEIIDSICNEKRILNVFEDSSKIYFKNCVKYKTKNHYKELKLLVPKAHEIFCIKRSGISDFKAVMKYVCLKLLGKKIILEEKQFHEEIKKLVSDKIVRSVMVGRDGIPKNMSI